MKRISNISALIIIVILVTINTYHCTITPSQVRCDKTTASLMDTLAAKLFVIGQNNLKFPENLPQLQVYCKDLRNFFASLKPYANACVPKFGRDTILLLHTSVTREINIICKPGKPSPKAEELMRAAVCANSGLDEFQKCNQEVITAYVIIMKAPVNQRIPMACCNYLKFRECLKKEAIDEKECTKSIVDFIDNYFATVMDNFLDSLCTLYDTEQKCRQYLRDTPMGKRSDVLPKSMVNPFIAIVSSIGDSPTL